MQTNDYKVGDKVTFGRPNGEQTMGTVIKVNPARLKIRQDEARGTLRTRPEGTVWTVHPSLCRKVGATVSMPAAPKTKRPDTEVMADIARVYCALSPENLHCDGEISRAAAAAKGARLRQVLRALFAEIGREVTESEAYGLRALPGEGTPVSRTFARPSAEDAGFKRGDKVSFDAKGQTIVGYVRQVNTRTVTVDPLGSMMGRYWRVSPSMLRKVA